MPLLWFCKGFGLDSFKEWVLLCFVVSVFTLESGMALGWKYFNINGLLQFSYKCVASQAVPNATATLHASHAGLMEYGFWFDLSRKLAKRDMTGM